MQSSIVKSLTATLRRACWSGTAATIFSGLTVAWRGHRERVGALRGINAVSHWLWGKQGLQQLQPSLRYTLPAIITHQASSMFWALLFEKWLQREEKKAAMSPQKIITRAAGVTALAWLVDYHLVPKRLTPGFERVISKPSLIMTYVAFGCGLSAIGLLSNDRKKTIANF